MQFYLAPLQGNLLRSAPSPTSVKQCGLKTREKKSRVGYWRQTQLNRQTIPSRRTSDREGSALSDNSPRSGTSNSAWSEERNERCNRCHMTFTSSLSHKLSHTFRPLPLEHDILCGRPQERIRS